jgi:hypothetical protein
MDVNNIKTEQDLKVWLAQENRKLDDIHREINEVKAQSSARRLELAEARMQHLAELGMDYNEAFELVTRELEEQERKIRTKREQAQAEKTDLQLEEMSEDEETLMLEEMGD